MDLTRIYPFRERRVRLTESDVATIRALYPIVKCADRVKRDFTVEELADSYLVSPACVWNIIDYKTWKDVKPLQLEDV